jgi:glutamine amidotransferase
VIAILDYNAGNLTSVQWALREVGVDSVITSDPRAVADADRLIFPGVGAAGAAMKGLKPSRLDAAVKDFIGSGRPYLGICIGCQVLLDRSEEDGGVDCLGVFQGTVRKFRNAPGVKVPHMGWNQVRFVRRHPVLEGIPDGAEFYFVHGYYPAPEDKAQILANTEYGGTVFSSLLARGNAVACQFHAEKSGPHGLRLLQNFCGWEGK